MPLKPEGEKVLSKLQNEYGPANGKRVFYALQNKGKLAKRKMEGRTPNRSKSR